MSKRKAALLSVSVSLAWGASYIFMKFGLSSVPPMTIVALRCGLAFILTFLIFRKRAGRVSGRLMLCGSITGALLFGIFLCLLYGVKGTSASTAGFLASTAVIIVPIINSVLTKTLPQRKIAIGVVVVTVGLFLLNGGSLSGFNAGALCCLLASLLYAVHIIVTNRFIEDVDALSIGIWQLGFAAVYALIGALLFETPVLPGSALPWVGILGLAFICSAYGFVMQAVLQKYIAPETMGFLLSLEPVFSAIFAFIFLHETLGVMGYIGAALIFLGVVIANLSGGAEKHAKQACTKKAPS